MLTVTESAKQLLWEMLIANSTEPDMGVRLNIETTGQLSLILDKEGYGDDIIEHSGEKILMMTPEVASLVDNITIDTKDTPSGPKLSISRA
jgi:Fe-S cluster assembly iron-binding protein IscA